MTLPSNIFSDPKLLKEWAIKVSNACGGLQMSTSPILKNTDMKVLHLLTVHHVLETSEIQNIQTLHIPS